MGGGGGGGGSDDGGTAFVAVDEKKDNQEKEDESRSNRRAAALVNKHETPFLSQLKAFHKRHLDKHLKIPVFCRAELDLQHVYHEARGTFIHSTPQLFNQPPPSLDIPFQRRLSPTNV